MSKYLFLKFIFLIAIASFVFQFAWEWFQCVPFFIHRGTQASPISMGIAAIGDVALTFLILGFVYLVTQRKQAFVQDNIKMSTFFLIELTAFFVAVGTEKIALATNRWAYTYINPLLPIFEVSILPVLQLMLIIPIVLFLTIKALRKNES